MVALGEQRFLNAFQDLQGSVHEAVETCQQQDDDGKKSARVVDLNCTLPVVELVELLQPNSELEQ